jgi:uncharacterized membrane protein YfcA
VSLIEIISLVLIGLAAGALGGLLGIGGSIIMIPILTLAFRHDQHLAQAAAMIVNVFVSGPAVIRHQQARAIEWRVVGRMLPAGLLFIIVGVQVSNLFDQEMLKKIFGLFLIYVIIVNVRKLLDRRSTDDDDGARKGWLPSSFVGGCMGFAAGLLGIGGGVIAVPLLQRICRLPLRRCIAVSATAMCVTSPIGAIRKNMTLPEVMHGTDVSDPIILSLLIAACLAPTAIIGALIGAGFTHSLSMRLVRGAFILLLTYAAARYLGLF